MHWQKLGIAALAVPAMLVTVAATTPPATTPKPTPVVTSPDPGCIATGCPVNAPAPTPSSGVLSAGTGPSTPNTGDGAPIAELASLPLLGLGLAAIRWARRRLVP